MKRHQWGTRNGLSNLDSINNWTMASIVITCKCQMCTWRIAANPKGAIFPPSVLLFVCLDWLSCPHLFVSRSDGVPTRRRLRSWGRPLVKKHLTFPLDVLGLHLSPGGVTGTPQLWLLSQHPSGHAGRECEGGGRITGDLPGGRLSGPALEPVPQPRSERAESSEAGQRRCQLRGQAHSGDVPYLCKRRCNGSSYLGSNRLSV